jgi:osmoprotectant transport system substrate-binding protein
MLQRDDTPDRASRSTDVVRVASFDFDESVLLGELFAQAIEREGVVVERIHSLGSREVVGPALRQGLVDVVPEYVAAALDFESFGEEVPLDVDTAVRQLQALLAEDDVSVLRHAPAVDRDAVAMHVDRAAELGITTLRDLAQHSGRLDFVGPPECPERTACLPHLEVEHGIEFRSFTGLPPGTAVALALEAGEADVGLMFSSDPLVEMHDLVLITDDRGTERPEHVVPLVRDDVLQRHGDTIVGSLGRVTAALTTEELVSLNRRVAEGSTPARAASEWLDRLADR